MNSAVPSDRPTGDRAIVSPVIDLLTVGGLSLIFFVPLLLSGRRELVLVSPGVQAWLATLINMPHFMASYRLVYASRDSMMKHRWASMYIPGILLAYIAVALTISAATSVLLIVLVTVSSAYLAWHYTGQVWGMMASFAYLGGLSFDSRERFLIRTGLRMLLAWHLSWFLYTQLRNPTAVRPIYLALSAGTAVAFGLGVAGLLHMKRRTGAFPPARSLVAWLALFSWYAVLARDPKALFWIQIAHAVQYLAFPLRVEVNRTKRTAPSRVMLHMAAYAAVLLIVSILVSVIVPGSAMSVVGNAFGEEAGKAAPIMILLFINIHHYFTDGVVWHISNPEVRADLFAHVPRPAAAAPKTGKRERALVS